jgi:signal transduction histidine kinase/HAMP domain-containing protein
MLAFLVVSLQALNASTQSALSDRKVVAQLMAERLDSHLTSVQHLLGDTVNDTAAYLQSNDLEPEKALLQTLYDRSSVFKRVVLMDGHGTVLWTVPYTEAMMGINMTAAPYNVSLALASQPAYSASIGPNTQKPGVAIIYAVPGASGGIAGYLSGWINLSDARAAALLFPYEAGAEAYTDLVSVGGLVLMSTRPERVGLTSDHGGRIGDLFRTKQTVVGTCHSCHEGQSTERENDVLAFAPLTVVPWGVALHQAEDQVFAATYGLGFRLFALGVGVLAILMGTLWIASRGLVRPLETLTEACREIAAGDWTRPVSSAGTAEISALAGSFEDMRRDLVTYRDRTEKNQRELEDRVGERTGELVQARDYLLKTNRNLSAINAVAAILAQSLDLAETLDAALSRVLEAVAAGSGGIYLRTGDGGLDLVAHQGLAPEMLARLRHLPGTNGPPGDDGGAAASGEQSCLGRAKTSLAPISPVCVTIEAKGEDMGVLFVGDRPGPEATPQEQTLLASIARQIGLAVHSANLYDVLRREESARAGLLRQVIAAQEDERKRIARELHDETSQALAALIVGLDTTRLALFVNPHDAAGRLAANKAIAETMLKDIHRITADLRPSLLDDLGLVPAISWYGEHRLKPRGIALDLQAAGMDQRLEPATETALFRIVQEAMTNVVRHAAASSVGVSLSRTNGNLTLRIADNGRGFAPEELPAPGSPGSGSGLLGMQERVSILGGDWTMESALGQGTVITVRVPVAAGGCP